VTKVELNKFIDRVKALHIQSVTIDDRIIFSLAESVSYKITDQKITFNSMNEGGYSWGGGLTIENDKIDQIIHVACKGDHISIYTKTG